MKLEYQIELEGNDNEYKKGLIPNTNLINQINEEPPSIYNPPQFQTNIIINNLKIYKLLIDKNICPTCGDLMNIVSNK